MADRYSDSDMASWNAKIMAEFRAGNGKVGGVFADVPLLLLTTVGARSGRESTTPLGYLPDGDRRIIFATNGGQARSPAWYHNLLAQPRVSIEIGTATGIEKHVCTATVLTGAERDSLWNDQESRAPVFAEYKNKTDRLIPVVALV
jgi:deazaflavin-dependent oxidoreductase (nitroreductase family)